MTHGWKTSINEKPLWFKPSLINSFKKSISPAKPLAIYVAPDDKASAIGFTGNSMLPCGVDLVLNPLVPTVCR